MFSKILIANRGEIVRRILRTCRCLGMATVAIYSEVDRESSFVGEADEAVLIEAEHPTQSYLNVEGIVEAACQRGAEAIHPGYGFLAESDRLAEACTAAGLAFVGPPASVLREVGDKAAARARMKEAGLPVVPGSPGPVSDLAEAERYAQELGYPLLVKAAWGGGGIGMTRVEQGKRLEKALRKARDRAERSFGSPLIYLEKYLEQPRHVEVQVLVEASGEAFDLWERECSMQRRHQKIMEEAPAPQLAEETREALHQAAVKAMKAVGYRNAGTVEFLVTAEEQFYFMEVNARLQVEHGVTEAVTGVDLVEAQLRIAAGEPSGIVREEQKIKGHAIQSRIYAEDPYRFLPSPGMIKEVRFPEGEHLRLDTWIEAGTEVTPFYDPMLARVIAWGEDRQVALQRLREALDAFVVEGIRTNLPLHRELVRHEALCAGPVYTSFLEGEFLPQRKS